LILKHQQVQGVTRIMIQGHYLHTHDGQFVQSGVFISDKETVSETANYLKENKKDQPLRKLIIFVESGLEAVAKVAERAAIITSFVKRSSPSLFPLFVIWNEDVEDLLIDLLEARSKRIEETTGGLPEATKSHLIRYAQNWLQPVWRTFEGEAERAFLNDDSIVQRGQGWWSINEIISNAVTSNTPMNIHFVAHSSGLVWLSQFARRIRDMESSLVGPLSSQESRRDSICSLDLLAPVGTINSIEGIVSSLWGDLPGQKSTNLRKRVRVFTLPTNQDLMTRLGGFQGSFLELARLAFPIDGNNPTRSDPNNLIGSRSWKPIEPLPAWLEFKEIESIISTGDLPEHSELMNDGRLLSFLLDSALDP